MSDRENGLLSRLKNPHIQTIYKWWSRKMYGHLPVDKYKNPHIHTYHQLGELQNSVIQCLGVFKHQFENFFFLV